PRLVSNSLFHLFPTRRSSDLSLLPLLRGGDLSRIRSLFPRMGLSNLFRRHDQGGQEGPALRHKSRTKQCSFARSKERLYFRCKEDRKSTRLNSSHEWISYDVF